MRNHGKSDHHKNHTYSLMADDVVRLLDKLKIPKVTVMAHSMGSKVTYSLACRYPSRVEGVITVDTAPRDFMKHYTSHCRFVKSIQSRLIGFDGRGRSRNQLIDEMGKMFNSKTVGKMAVNNMKFDNDTISLGWESNMPAILDHYEDMRSYKREGQYTGHLLFLNSGK